MVALSFTLHFFRCSARGGLRGRSNIWSEVARQQCGTYWPGWRAPTRYRGSQAG